MRRAAAVKQVRSDVCGRHPSRTHKPDAWLRHWRWHLDEMYAKLNGDTVYLWRAVDHKGEVLESYANRTRDKVAALAFMKKALKLHGSPEAITTDDLRSNRAAMNELGDAEKQEDGFASD